LCNKSTGISDIYDGDDEIAHFASQVGGAVA